MDTSVTVAGGALVVPTWPAPATSNATARLVRNDLFQNPGGLRFRVLEIAEDGAAWIINVSDKDGWPRECRYEHLLQAIVAKEFNVLSSTGEGQLPFRSEAADARLKEAWDIIKPLVKNPAIFHPKLRGPLVTERAESTGASRTTIYKHLRTYWCGGQSKQALIANFPNIGLKQSGKTNGRGRAPLEGWYKTYQMDPKVDEANIKGAVKKHYLSGDVATLAGAYHAMLAEHYSYLDSNGKSLPKDFGECPTYRQFLTVVKRCFTTEEILRRKKGNRDFERDHSHKIIGALHEAKCVGHIYEIDATIADVYLVAMDNRSKIIGKPTLYLIYDRFSRLCVGFYVGLEHPGWEAAMQAILSIAEDKEALCLKYGIEYDPRDWPAHGMFPQKFLGDCGEMISRNSNRICVGMESTISNAPPLTPQNKGTVECGFRLLHQSIAMDTPGYEPARNLMRRRGKKYDQDASLTLDEFIKIVLAAIIKHNRSLMPNYGMTPAMVLQELPPTPIDIWEHDMPRSAGMLSRYTEDYLRLQLLPRDKATVTESGILFKDCYYSCPELEQLGWFITAKNRGRWDVELSYDRRLVNGIVVHTEKNGRKSYLCELTPRSAFYNGYSFAEVAFVENEAAATQRANKNEDRRQRVQLHTTISEIAKPARAAAKKASAGKSRASRKRDIAEDRNKERSQRRAGEAAINLPTSYDLPSTPTGNAAAPHPQNLHGPDADAASSMPSGTSSDTSPLPAGAEATSNESARPLTFQEKLRMKQKELVNALTK